MLSAFTLVFVRVLETQADIGHGEFFTSRVYFAARLIGALLIATAVPLLIDRRARRSSRVRR